MNDVRGSAKLLFHPGCLPTHIYLRTLLPSPILVATSRNAVNPLLFPPLFSVGARGLEIERQFILSRGTFA